MSIPNGPTVARPRPEINPMWKLVKVFINEKTNHVYFELQKGAAIARRKWVD
jgi:hypothetical protein